jgi:hypothetical protein
MRAHRTRRSCCPCSRGTARTRLSPWTHSQPPTRRTREASTSPGWIEGNFPQTDPRPDALLGWPEHSPSWTASCTSAPCEVFCSGACPSPRGVSSSAISTRACAATTRRRAPLWATCSAWVSIGPPRSPTPARSCTPAKCANFTLAKLTSQLTPSKRSRSRGPSPCGGWTSSGPRPGLHPPAGCH